VPEGWDDRPYRHLELTPLARTLGARVAGVDLAREPAAEVWEELERALLEWKVLVFVGQDLSPADQGRLVAHWGDLFDDTLVPDPDGYLAPFVLAGPASASQNYWHADDTYMERPACCTALRIPVQPPLGGDTVFSDMAAAYDNLDPALAESLLGLRAVHDCGPYAAETAHYQPHYEDIVARYPPVEHPVVRTHPGTGRRTLFVNSIWTQAVVGLPPAESARLLLHLCVQATVPEYQCRVRWTPDTLVLWDNRALQHYAVGDYSEPRTLLRATVRGERPT